ncbi:MAG: hypothetical protein ABIG61_01880 [Planctomycetota bacterium]
MSEDRKHQLRCDFGGEVHKGEDTVDVQVFIRNPFEIDWSSEDYWMFCLMSAGATEFHDPNGMRTYVHQDGKFVDIHTFEGDKITKQKKSELKVRQMPGELNAEITIVFNADNSRTRWRSAVDAKLPRAGVSQVRCPVLPKLGYSGENDFLYAWGSQRGIFKQGDSSVSSGTYPSSQWSMQHFSISFGPYPGEELKRQTDLGMSTVAYTNPCWWDPTAFTMTSFQDWSAALILPKTK